MTTLAIVITMNDKDFKFSGIGRLPDITAESVTSYTTLSTFASTSALSGCGEASTAIGVDRDATAVGENALVEAAAMGNGGGVIKRDTESIYCTTGNCDKSRDWLTSVPNAAAAWAVGSIALIQSMLLLFVKMRRKSPGFFGGVLAMLELTLSLYLRASVGYSSGRERAIYQASLFFNFLAGVELCHLLSVTVLGLGAHFDPRITVKQIFARTFSRLLSVCLVGLLVAAVVLMFDANPVHTSAGSHMVQAVLFAVLLVSVLMAVFAAQVTAIDGSVFYRRHFVAVIVPLLLVGVWAGYMVSRTFLPVDSVARTSEALLYGLNYAPLLLAGLTLIALDAPRLFDFDKFYR
ncbi:hypothetical protein GGI04_003814 [Coemansia thaxteri]|nr:hypothetical protein GGI04_003814 [Coemansia thaxteri]